MASHREDPQHRSRQQRRAEERKARKARSKKLAGAALTLGTALALPAGAATITVNSIADTVAVDAQCTLREAIQNANANARTNADCIETGAFGADTINFALPMPSTITLGGTQLRVTDSLDIQGPGQANLTISGNNASRVFYIYQSVVALDVSISGLTLTQGSATSGGAIFNKENLTISNATLTANNATTNRGGALYSGGLRTLTLQNVIVSGNTAVNGGGAIQGYNTGNVSVQSSTFSGNTVNASGGAILVSSPSADVSITGTTFTNNDATDGSGGAFNVDAVNVTVQNTTLSGNYASVSGGGAYVVSSAAVTLDTVTIANNIALTSGGGGFKARVGAGGLTITNSQITGNQSGDFGGGFYIPVSAGPIAIDNTTIAGNTAVQSGGGGGINSPNAPVTIRRTTFSANMSGYHGGGLYFQSAGPNLLLENLTISGNTAAMAGGGIDINLASAFMLKNSTIAGNTAASGGNIALGYLTTNSAIGTIENSIVADGTAAVAPDVATRNASTLTSRFTLIETPGAAAIVDGGGNIFGMDPMLGALANNGGPTQTRRPAATSPVVNAGDPAFVPPPATDQRGLPRVAGGRIDMGSVELQPGTIALTTAAASVAENGGTITVTATRTGGTEGTVAVAYTTANGTAIAPGDYATTSGTFIFPDGSAVSQSVMIPIVNDAVFEADETFTFTISMPTGGAVIGVPSTETITILNDDANTVDLSITKTGPASAPQATNVTFNITVNNIGGTNATGVTVTDVLPPGAQFVSATPSQGSCNGTTTVTCNLGGLNAASNATIALTVQITAAAGGLSNTATVTATQMDSDATNNTSTALVIITVNANIPTMSEWMLAALGMMLAMLALAKLRH